MTEEQEVELIDYLRVIWKRKALIVGGTLVAAIASLLVSLSLPKTYEVSRTLRIAQVQGKAIEGREGVIDRLLDQRALAELVKEFQLSVTPNAVAHGMISVESRKRGNPEPLVRFTVGAPDPDLAVRVADWLAIHIIDAHNRIYSEAVQIITEYEREVSATIRSIQAEITGMKGTLDKIVSSPKVDAPAVILLQANVEDRQRNLANLRKELKSVRLSRLASQNTSVISADATPQVPVKPKVKLNVTLAGTLGLMVFTFLAFFLEYLANVRREESGVRSEG